MIDRLQKATLISQGVDLHSAIITMGRLSEWWIGYCEIERVCFDADIHMLSLTQRGVGAPVFSALQQVGKAFYLGDQLDLDIPLPETIALASAGRRLGEIVETQSPQLNQRRIRSMAIEPIEAVRKQQGWTVTSIYLDPDHVQIGPREIALAGCPLRQLSARSS